MLRRNLTLCVCVFHQRERLMTTTRQQESRVMQSGICDDVFFLFSLENPPLFCSELQQGFDLKAGSKSPASPLTHGVPVHASLFPAAEIFHGAKGDPDFMDKDDRSVPCRRGLKTCSLPEVITGNLKGGRRRRRRSLWSCMRNSQKQS